MVVSHQGGPHAALVASAEEDEEPERRPHEAEDGHEHHPAQRVVWHDASRSHQDPDQTSEHLQRGEREEEEALEFSACDRLNFIFYEL